jgi:hypothetical protein
MERLKTANAQQAKRYLVNKIPEMSTGELLIIQSIIQKQLRSVTPQEEEHNRLESEQQSDWEMLKSKLQTQIRHQLLYNAIESRLLSSAHVFE